MVHEPKTSMKKITSQDSSLYRQSYEIIRNSGDSGHGQFFDDKKIFITLDKSPLYYC